MNAFSHQIDRYRIKANHVVSKVHNAGLWAKILLSRIATNGLEHREDFWFHLLIKLGYKQLSLHINSLFFFFLFYSILRTLDYKTRVLRIIAIFSRIIIIITLSIITKLEIIVEIHDMRLDARNFRQLKPHGQWPPAHPHVYNGCLIERQLAFPINEGPTTWRLTRVSEFS
ncbi:ion transport 2 domain protein [Striga asiatica]|uniref:Ion transport 2 domain protein n=1 Tax=Striga asiatica TaxID=4170 RepID=A0A5A7PPF4_STRAF|nr:ion transport 2 domain protein [Striga asiatica]